MNKRLRTEDFEAGSCLSFPSRLETRPGKVKSIFFHAPIPANSPGLPGEESRLVGAICPFVSAVSGKALLLAAQGVTHPFVALCSPKHILSYMAVFSLTGSRHASCSP